MLKKVKLTLTTLTILCSLLLSGPGEAGEPGKSASTPPLEFEDHVIWDRQDLTKAVFVPQAQLKNYRNDDYLEALLMRPEAPSISLDEFEAMRDLAFRDPSNHCSVSSNASTSPYTFPSDVDLTTWLEGREAAVISTGEVLDVVTGWGGHAGVTTLIYVRLKDILSCNDTDGRAMRSGDVVSIALRAGALLVDGRFLCNATDLSLTIPAPGDQVLVTGHPAQGFEHYLGTGVVHVIRDDLVEPQPVAGVSPRKPVPLAEIVQRLDKHPQECG